MSLLQTIRCKLGKHLWKPVRNRHWVQSECVQCGATGPTHFIPLMKNEATPPPSPKARGID